MVESGVMMNGVLTNHYRFDQSGLSIGTFGSAAGEAWVAQAGNVVVKYMGQGTGKSALIGKTLDGTITWEFSVDAINQDVRITLPAECEKEKPAKDIPVPPKCH
jgi:hypothetical protein